LANLPEAHAAPLFMMQIRKESKKSENGRENEGGSLRKGPGGRRLLRVELRGRLFR
jgi:hypothetical protein